MATQEQLLAALGAAHEAGDQDTAMHIAEMIRTGQYDPSKAPTIEQPAGNTSGSPGNGMPLGSAIKEAAKDVGGIGETALNMGTGAAGAIAGGYAGAGADLANLFGAHTDPAAVVHKVQNAMTYQPRLQTGQELTGGVGKVAGLIPEGADIAGQKVTDVTGSPALGTAVNTGLQGLGMWATGKIPGAAESLRDAPVIKPTLDFASDMMPGGSRRAATRLIQQYAGGPGAATQAAAAIKAHLAAQAALDQAGASGSLASKYGIQPTTAPIARNAGLAQMERTLRNQGDLTTAFNDRDAANQGAINDILEGISGSPEDRLRAGAARDFKARTMYDDALNNPEHFVQPPTPDMPSFANEEAAKRGLTQDGTPPVNDPNAPASGLNDIGVRLQEVLQRPAVADAMTNASRVAANFGVKLDQRNLIQQMHYAKMHLDDQIGAAQAAGKTNDFRALLDSKNALLGVMDDLSPAYAQARSNFSTASRPVNRMDIGEALRQKYMSALGDAGGTGTRPSSFAEALRNDNGDQIARTATGFGGAKINQILTPEDMVSLAVARDQLARQQFAQTAGRGVGSNTGQNLANQRAIDNVGSVNQIAEDMGPAAGYAAAMHHPAVAIPAAIMGGVTRRGARSQLAQMALDPESALKALQAQGTPPLSEAVTMPAAVGAVENNEGHADGGKVQKTMDEWKAGTLHSGSKQGPVVTNQKQAVAIALNQERKAEGHAEGGAVAKKFTFWDLAQQALKELTGGDQPQDAPLGQGAASQAAQQIEANPNRIMNQADAQS